MQESTVEEMDSEFFHDDYDASAVDELEHESSQWIMTPMAKKPADENEEVSPVLSEFQFMIATATSADTPAFEIEDMDQQQRRHSFASGNSWGYENNTGSPMADKSDDAISCLSLSSSVQENQEKNRNKEKGLYSGSLEETPVRSNLSYTPATESETQESDVAPKPSTMSSFLSRGEIEEGDRYTPAVSIQSSTPRTKKILESFDPTTRSAQPDINSWPVAAVATALRPTDTPERPMPKTANEMPGSKVSEWWIPRPLRLPKSGSSSPVTSLPSMLGDASQNEVSDLESPLFVMPYPNFKFSEEESTIQSQSVQDLASEINSSGLVSPSLRSMLHNTYNISGALKQETATPRSVLTVSAGCPTDEGPSPTSVNGGRKFQAKPKGRDRNLICPTRTKDTTPSPTDNHAFTFGETFTEQKDPRPRTSTNRQRWIRLCIILGGLLAIAATVAIPLVMKSISNKSEVQNLTGNQNEGNVDPTKVTNSPTGAPVSLLITDAPTVADTIAPSASSTDRPTVEIESQAPRPSITPPKDDDVGDTTPPPTTSPTIAPSQSASHSNISTASPTDSSTIDSMSGWNWDRMEVGEDIWRDPAIVPSSTPIWYFAAVDGDSTTSSNSGIELEVINAAEVQYLSQIRQTVDDYRQSPAVESLKISSVPYESSCQPELGKIKVCSGNYGFTAWDVSTTLFLSKDYTVAAAIRINGGRKPSAAAVQYGLCHQLGHTFGLAHHKKQSCMRDIVGAVVDDSAISSLYQHPNAYDLEALVSLYGPAEASR
jgi:hypothetical protein